MNVCRPLARWGSSTLGSSFNMEEDEIRALQRPPHLLDFGPLTPSELVNHLECMPRQFAEIVACRFRWMLRSLRIAWMWFCFEVFHYSCISIPLCMPLLSTRNPRTPGTTRCICLGMIVSILTINYWIGRLGSIVVPSPLHGGLRVDIFLAGKFSFDVPG